MRNTVFGFAGAAVVSAFASPAFGADLPAYRDGGTAYQRESHTYERQYQAPRVVHRPVVQETVVARRPLVVHQPYVIVEGYPVYAMPYPPVVAYGGRGLRPRYFDGHFHAPRHWGGGRRFGSRW